MNRTVRLAVVADSHGVWVSLERLIKALEADGGYDAIIHLGDYGSDGEELEQASGLPCYWVNGNCDGFFSDRPKSELELEFNGCRLFVTHGHQYGVKRGIALVAECALEKGAQVCLFGHTHMRTMEVADGVLCLNPGSLSIPRTGSPAFIELDIDGNGKPTATFHELKEN